MLIIHIGMPKTGTTSIQKTFFDNNKIIENYGIIYPCDYCNAPFDYGQNSLAISILENPEGEGINNFINELSLEEDKNVFLSAEWFFNGLSACYRDNFIALIKRLSIVTEIVIIAFMRRFDSFIDAAFRLEVKNGTISNFSPDEYAKTRLPWFEDVLNTLSKLSKIPEIASLRIIPYRKNMDSVKKLMSEMLFPPALRRAMGALSFENSTPGLKELALFGFYIDTLSVEIPAFSRARFLADLARGDFSIPDDVFRYSLFDSHFANELHGFANEASRLIFRQGYYDHFSSDTIHVDDSTVTIFNKNIVSAKDLELIIFNYRSIIAVD